jgi:hypothetical protein
MRGEMTILPPTGCHLVSLLFFGHSQSTTYRLSLTCLSREKQAHKSVILSRTTSGEGRLR